MNENILSRWRIPFSVIPSIILVFVLLFSFQLFAQLAAGHDKFLGNIIGNSIHPTFLSYWNQATPENRGKWISIEGSRDVYNWSGLDQAYNYAIQYNITFKDHTLVWGNAQGEPFWISSLSLTEQAEEVEEWIQLVGQRYPETAMVDVVNEPLHEYPVFADALGGSGATGWDWVIWSFQMARQYFLAGLGYPG